MTLVLSILASAIVVVAYIERAQAQSTAGGGSTDCDCSKKGISYDISATRFRNIINPDNPLFYIDDEVTPKMNLTTFDNFGPDNPFMLRTTILVDSVEDVFSTPDGDFLNTCTDYKTGWKYVTKELFNRGFMPNGSCSVSKGSYEINEDVPTFSATFPDKIPCGQYICGFEILAKAKASRSSGASDQTDGGTYSFAFTIPEGDDCVPVTEQD